MCPFDESSPRLRCEYNVPRCYVKCKYFFHGFAINFFRFVTYLNPKFSQIQHYVNQLRYFLPFFAVSVTFSSIPFGLTSEFLSFVRNHLLHFLIVTYKTLALYLCSHSFQNFFGFLWCPRNRIQGFPLRGSWRQSRLMRWTVYAGKEQKLPAGTQPFHLIRPVCALGTFPSKRKAMGAGKQPLLYYYIKT